VFEEFGGRLVHPVEVFEEEDHGMLLSEALEETARGAEDMTAHGLAVEVLDALHEGAADFEREEGSQVGQNVSHLVGEEGSDAVLQFGPARIGAIVVVDAGASAEDFEEGPVANGLTVGEGTPFKPEKAAVGELAASFGDEPGLTEPGLAYDKYDAAVAGQEAFETLR